jgi:hydrogenase nickel incorporation protein HypA/HybF
MHELSIVMSIVDAAKQQVKLHQANKVESITLEIGTLAGIEPDALSFAWKAAVPNTILEGAEQHINYVQAQAQCLSCRQPYEVEQVFEPCPICGEYLNELVKGKELKIKSLTLI